MRHVVNAQIWVWIFHESRTVSVMNFKIFTLSDRILLHVQTVVMNF